MLIVAPLLPGHIYPKDSKYGVHISCRRNLEIVEEDCFDRVTDLTEECMCGKAWIVKEGCLRIPGMKPWCTECSKGYLGEALVQQHVSYCCMPPGEANGDLIFNLDEFQLDPFVPPLDIDPVNDIIRYIG